MEKETTAKTTPLVSSADNENFDLLLYQPLGDGTEKIYLYKTDADQEEPKQTGTDKVTNVVETGADSAQLETKTTRWVYKVTYHACCSGSLITMANMSAVPIRSHCQIHGKS